LSALKSPTVRIASAAVLAASLLAITQQTAAAAPASCDPGAWPFAGALNLGTINSDQNIVPEGSATNSIISMLGGKSNIDTSLGSAYDLVVTLTVDGTELFPQTFSGDGPLELSMFNASPTPQSVTANVALQDSATGGANCYSELHPGVDVEFSLLGTCAAAAPAPVSLGNYNNSGPSRTISLANPPSGWRAQVTSVPSIFFPVALTPAVELQAGNSIPNMFVFPGQNKLGGTWYQGSSYAARTCTANVAVSPTVAAFNGVTAVTPTGPQATRRTAKKRR
jgi:hypothetical protein